VVEHMSSKQEALRVPSSNHSVTKNKQKNPNFPMTKLFNFDELKLSVFLYYNSFFLCHILKSLTNI
jgi:hypothetical protein